MLKFSLECLNNYIKEDYIDGYSFRDVDIDFEITPKEFLEFAEYDLTATYNHHLVNCLSNTKRAIDSQLDSLLFGFGLSERSKRWRFPAKIDFLNIIGIISPRILNRINRKRNLLEHEYKNPSKEEVEDALDVAILFIAYTDKYIFHALGDCRLYGEQGSVEITLDWSNCRFVFTYLTYDVNGVFNGENTEELLADQEEYDDYLRFYLELYNTL